MNFILKRKNIYLFIFIYSIIAILSAIYIEKVLGYLPCKLCIYQRIPFLVAIFICFLGYNYVKSDRILIALITFLIAPISGIVPNTPVVASLLPLIEGWCERRNISPSKVLLPLSFATLLGGTLTLLGSSVNLLVSDISQQLGYGALELFRLTSIGIPVWLIGTTYMILVSDMLLTDRGRDKEFIKNGDMNIYFTEVTIPSTSELVGQSVRNSRLQRRFDVDVLELLRNGKVILPP